MSPWVLSHRADPAARVLADRHYNRQKIGSPQFVPPGRCVVFISRNALAFWVTSWPYAEFVKHAWAGHAERTERVMQPFHTIPGRVSFGLDGGVWMIKFPPSGKLLRVIAELTGKGE